MRLHLYIVYWLSGSQFMCVIDTNDIVCVCVDIGPHPLAGYHRRRGRVEGLDSPSHEHRRCRSTLDSLCLDIECLLDGVIDDG